MTEAESKQQNGYSNLTGRSSQRLPVHLSHGNALTPTHFMAPTGNEPQKVTSNVERVIRRQLARNEDLMVPQHSGASTTVAQSSKKKFVEPRQSYLIAHE